MVAVALPLAPLAPGAAAAAGTFVAGSVAYVAQQVYGFRAPLPPLPRVGGKAGGPTLRELVADAIAGARVPVALPPNPLGPRGNWAAIGAAALLGLLARSAEQLWGLYQRSPVGTVDPLLGPEGPRETTGSINLQRYINGDYGGAYITNIRLVTSVTAQQLVNALGPYLRYTVSFVDTNGLARTGTGSTYLSNNDIAVFENVSGEVVDPGLQPEPLYPAPAPTIEPAPQVAPTIAPPLPVLPVPVQPEPEPEIQPLIVPFTPGPTAPPATAPLVPRRTFPIPLREASPTQDGALMPEAPAPVAVTPPDAHFPVPGAPPVTGNGPRPTPEGIAQELGRLEQKVARLSNPQTDATGDASDRIGLALKLLGDIVEFFYSISAGGGYALSSPCEVDGAGNRIPVQVNYAGAPTALGVISNKLDAVAALLQVHKDLKQPICRQTPAVGESVTVQFVQVD